MIAAVRSAQPAPLFRVVETALQFSQHSSINPWSLAGSTPGCQAVLMPPAGSRYSGNMTLPLFYDGDAADGSWELAFRFTPDVAGSWPWTLQCAPLKLLPGEPSAGTVTVASTAGADGTGGVVGGRTNPQLYEREDGSRWTPIGYEMDWLWAMGMVRTASMTPSLCCDPSPPSALDRPPFPPEIPARPRWNCERIWPCSHQSPLPARATDLSH